MTPLRTMWLWIVFLALGAGAALPVPAFSQPYVRLGVSLDWTEDTRFQDADCSASGNLYGCGAGLDGAPKGSLGDFETITGLELGLGYNLLLLRLEAVLQYRPDFAFEGRSNYDHGVWKEDPTAMQDVSAELSVLSGTLAGYLDVPFPNFGLLWLVPVRTFAGLGLGLSRIEIGETRMDFPVTSTIVPGGHQTSFSWMLSAGFSVSLTRWLAVDLAWRYTDHGAIETARGEGQVVCRIVGSDACKTFNEAREARNMERETENLAPLPLVPFPLDDLAETKGDLRGHGIIASLRYSF